MYPHGDTGAKVALCFQLVKIGYVGVVVGTGTKVQFIGQAYAVADYIAGTNKSDYADNERSHFQ